MTEYEVSLLGYMHVYDLDSKKEAIRKVNKEGKIGHPQGVELVEENNGDFVFDVYSHLSIEADNEEEAEEKAMNKAGFGRFSDISIEEVEVKNFN